MVNACTLFVLACILRQQILKNADRLPGMQKALINLARKRCPFYLETKAVVLGNQVSLRNKTFPVKDCWIAFSTRLFGNAY
ncbi:hypothetical protein CEXT_180161 [Caerostris extrusa]|uniref:Uncharacterized protein n=1 Tax=Caerostris extrusa TaxID=172846 RepID=A0AAV4RLA4_CAEEX|nr:hypothetical protein CEXT_180161 [Caerostris extrusa]